MRRLSKAAVNGTTRIMAFIVLCIGAEISWTGLSTLISSLRV
jgi:small neutral amino acid transporter SnatA (MarC family)